MRNFLTSRHTRYWANRKINWTDSYFNLDHPHRDLIVKALSRIKFNSIIEIGCASGANLKRIKDAYPHTQIGGVDINKDAIETAKQLLPLDTAVLEVSPATKLFLSDKSVDCLLSDMIYIYLDPFNINKAIKEMKRVTRNNILLVEFHSSNWFKRMALRIFSGYNAYNWYKLLKKHGFYNIELLKLSNNDWPGGNPQKTFGYIISAKL